MPDELLTGSLEENVLTVLCWDEDNAAALAARITPELFSTRAYSDIAKVSINHLERFNVPPKAHLRDLFETKIRKGTDDAKLLRLTLDAMEKLSMDIQAEYVLVELDQFITTRQLSMALEKSMELLARGKLSEAQDAVHDITINRQASTGIWLHDTTQSLSFFDNANEDLMASGIPLLDERGVCPARETLFMWIAPLNKGKTWALINCGAANIMQGKNVLHLTLEMKDKKIAQRYVQNIFALAREEVGLLRVPRFQRDDMSRCVGMDFSEFDAQYLSVEKRDELEKRMQNLKRRGKLFIQGFESGTLSAEQYDAFLSFLEKKHKFVPDVVLLDYWDLMAVDESNLRISTGRMGVKIRGIAQRRQHALVTASQSSKEGEKSSIIRSRHSAEDYSKGMTADTVVTYNQTDAEYGIGLARIFVDKARDVARGYQVLISQAYGIGQFCIDAVMMSGRVAEQAKSMAGES